MIMMVLNKSKLKKIIILILVILLGLSGGVMVLKLFNNKPVFNLFNGVDLPYERGTKDKSGYVALTCNVDLGWETEYIESILETLKKENVKITFNVTGKWAEKNKDELLKIKKQGHEIGNHGYKHLDYSTLSYEDNYEQIETSKKIIEEIINEKTKFFQAPAGSFGAETVKAAKELGYTSIKWDADTIDWKYKDQPEVIIDRMKKKDIKDSSIILMHPTDATTKCIDDIIAIVREKGLKPGKLSDVFK
ncbi:MULTISPECIES: polysaccharide deacetylase family protein [Clostridioides]|uniref:polysaccharide deacetylase family protein n=1 Tax=unclassified Clostridioides TaxID=2635829 RepID=UPI001D10ADCF|nr:polysaccharide deacetylase family protein [Clostridioides sp. ZZV15-6388]MCC0643972.1 polysaccharide deacetylase family protein [Clostridioides sp. ZZV14-6150]MCC0646824.1 polysaccharide deacetylase family protein [Clostridioides sp. ZZV15-6598]MCC0659676.1 polysaccharide deacetylase family protein [Clostridioides sp. ZZV14-6154]MCC0664201.1 polysaccharide deacetylase family protein [Clostridioides sp. ZZV15-6597]MCC0666809.1 polysaccharide deacetylase family protein [Clostridioides sp. ZZV